MHLREPCATSHFHRNATSHTQSGVHESSAVLRILHLICDDSTLSCLHSRQPTRPRAAPDLAPLSKTQCKAQGSLLDFEFKACSHFGKCDISRTAELSRYHWVTLCGRTLWRYHCLLASWQMWYLELTQLMRDLVRTWWDLCGDHPCMQSDTEDNMQDWAEHRKKSVHYYIQYNTV